MSTDFINQPMLTCIGNKRKLLNMIEQVLERVKGMLNKERLDILDAFCGSTVVSRMMVRHAGTLLMNDLELYAYLMQQCFFQIPSIEQQERIKHHIDTMNAFRQGVMEEGIVSLMYAPKVTDDVQEGERCFYTRENALFIDTCRKYIDEQVENDIRVYCLVPLLVKASIHTNTAGVFKGFYKKDGVGCFGGRGGNALSRITHPFLLEVPVWHGEDVSIRCYNKDINVFIKEMPQVDIIYADPPYNQHPYGSNYFMLNVVAENRVSGRVSKMSGIPKSWNKSTYNYKKTAIEAMKEFVRVGLEKAKFILISYNDEGIIAGGDWEEIFRGYDVEKIEYEYNTFRGCRNLKNRNSKVMEIMYLVSAGSM